MTNLGLAPQDVLTGRLKYTAGAGTQCPARGAIDTERKLGIVT